MAASCDARRGVRCDAAGVPVRALIVDDNQQFLDGARVLLEREGMTIVGVATSSADALRRADELRPDVALVDIRLGEESGFELARRLDGTVILISIDGHNEWAAEIAASLAVGFIPKAQLSASAIRRVLVTGASAPPAPSPTDDSIEVDLLPDEQVALRRVATLVAAGAAPAEVFAAVAKEVAQLIPADGAALTRFESDGTVTALGGWTTGGGYRYSGRTYSPEGTVSGRVFETRRPARVDSYADARGGAAEAAREMGWRSSVGAPIDVGGRLWGVLAVVARSEQPLPGDAERRLVAFTELVATSIANTESSAELRVRSEEQAALRRVAMLVAQGLPAPEIMDAVATEAGRLLEADWAAVNRFDPDDVVTVLSSHGSLGFEVPVGAQALLDGGGVVASVNRTGRSARLHSFEGVSGSWATRARELGVRSAVAAPITVEDRLWGALVATWKKPGPVPIIDAERLLAGFTEVVATAIANAESREELTVLAEEQAALRRVATLVAEGAEPNHVFAAVADEVAAMFGVPIAAMFRFDSDGFATLLATAGSDLAAVGGRYPVENTGILSRVFATGRSVYLDDWTDVPGRGAELARQAAIEWSVGVPIIVGGTLWGLVIAASQDAASFSPQVETRLASFTELVGTAIANSEAHEQLAQLADAQAALRRVATVVAEGATPDRVFDAVRDEVARMFNAPLSVLMRYDANGIATVLATADGYLGPVGRTWQVDGDGSAIARVCQTGRPARIDYTEPVDGSIADAARSAGARSAVGVPVVVDGALWGVMAVGSSEPLPADSEERLAKFTELLATAIANAEGRAALDASRARIVATADATRKRIERDLHDGAQQQLVWLALALRAAQATLPEGLEQHRNELSRVVDGLTALLEDLRETALGIHPAGLAEDGLTPALKRLVARSPLRVNLDIRAEGRFPEPEEVAAYYVVSEALTNAAKYADVPAVDVVVAIDGGALRVDVRDDGRGGADPADGSGLVGLRDRVEALGGTMRLTSPPGSGTALWVALPLRDRSAPRC